MLTLAGRPMYFMEMAFGQYAGRGILTCWSCAPIMKGIGFAMITLSLIFVIYATVIMAYSLHFIIASFQSILPWTKCDPNWINCITRLPTHSSNLTNANMTSSSQLYFERTVLNMSEGIEDIGGLQWELVIFLAISWFVVIGCLAKGIKSLGKVMYFAAIFPYIILTILAITGLTRPGAWQGIWYFLKPDFSKLFTIKVWQAAASQTFFSLGVSSGAIITYSSYNKFTYNFYR